MCSSDLSVSDSAGTQMIEVRKDKDKNYYTKSSVVEGIYKVANDLGEPKPKADISIIFDLVDEGPPTNIARDKDKMVGEAVWANYLRKTGRKGRRTTEPVKSRR